ncbi:SusD/RagB family nutrient-binding outer membrane lipoprotein [Pedobacter boryungensis]|uniref:SusD/RagB family nutrient-binding outer membrane lipoprotein n=1 Tax=Pedobacter boryungensis TaxID=869962 RepID=A0ABX2DG43_9SPHI|nr:SusD/RagB family nutrient-binding outer membrane lipoprotein [Pedobacter boryungensis]NQX33074.1 SusD/RagB family nutrient-binding outer membrane lipoprotein [Pedobacter boryungensis]
MKIKYIKGIAMLSLMFAVTGCEKNFLDINSNPNIPTTTTPELVLPAALTNTGAAVNNNLNVLGNLLTGNWGQSPDFLFYQPQETYQLTPNTYDAVWTSIYAGGLNDYKYVENQAITTGKKNAIAISKIMQAYNFQLLVDTWGDIPFSDALKGAAGTTPKYDKAEDVYDGILAMIDAGIASINTAAGADNPSASSDIMFGGSNVTTAMAKWLRFANTLKLRVLLRQSLIPSRATKVAAGFASLAGQSFLNAGENAGVNPGYINQAGKYNPLYGQIGFNVAGAETSNYQATRANKYAVDFLLANADPRISLLYRAAVKPVDPLATYVGVYPGTTATPTTKKDNYSAVGAGVLPSSANSGFSKSAYLLTAAEGFFLQAEAYLKGYLPGGAAAAQTAYQTGIEESFKLLGSTAAAANTYYTSSTQPLVNWVAATTAGSQFEAIITQKWIANNGFNGNEAWAEYRRTGFPTNIPIGLNNSSGGKLPLRMPYPQNEMSTNGPNVPVINIFTDKIFWEK